MADEDTAGATLIPLIGTVVRLWIVVVALAWPLAIMMGLDYIFWHAYAENWGDGSIELPSDYQPFYTDRIVWRLSENFTGLGGDTVFGSLGWAAWTIWDYYGVK